MLAPVAKHSQKPHFPVLIMVEHICRTGSQGFPVTSWSMMQYSRYDEVCTHTHCRISFKTFIRAHKNGKVLSQTVTFIHSLFER